MIKCLLRVVLSCALVCGALPAGALRADEGQKQAFEEFKTQYSEFKGTFKDTKEKVDGTVEFFAKFSNAITTWRGAVRRETQQDSIEQITDLAKDQLGIIDTLAEEFTNATGITIPASYPDAIKDKITAKFFDSLPTDKKNKFGFMYTLSTVDKKLAGSGVYDKLATVKKQFDKGSKLLEKISTVVEFTDTFSPTGPEDGPVGGLKKIKGVLDTMGSLTGEIPLMGDIIKGYATVTEGFVTALTDLDKKLYECREGSLGGQVGVDVRIKEKIFAEYKDVEFNCMTYYSINRESPLLEPIRGWKDKDVVLYFGDASGNGEAVLINGGSFDILYRYYAALKKSTLETSQKLATPEQFIIMAKATGSKSLAAIDATFRGYYAAFEGASSYNFVTMLKSAGNMDKERFLVSVSGRKMEYQVYSQKEDEFAGLCYFNAQFRNDVKALIDKFGNRVSVSGEIRTQAGSPDLGELTLTVNDEVKTTKVKDASTAEFEFTAAKDAAFLITVKAKGFKDYTGKGLKGPYIKIELEPLQKAGTKPSFKIIVPEKMNAGDTAEFKVDLGTTSYADSRLFVYWKDNGVYMGNDTPYKYEAKYIGPHVIECVFRDTTDNKQIELGKVAANMEITSAGGYGVSMTINGKSAVTQWGSPDWKAKLEYAKTPPFEKFAIKVVNETTKEEIQSITPQSWNPIGSLVNYKEFQVYASAPQAGGTYTFAVELYAKSGEKVELLARATKEMQVALVRVKAPERVDAMKVFTVNAELENAGDLGGGGLLYNYSPGNVIYKPDGSAMKTYEPGLTEVKGQFPIAYVKDGVVNNAQITVSVYSSDQKFIARGNAAIAVVPVKLGAVVPGRWEGGPTRFRRTEATSLRPDGAKSGSVSAYVNVDYGTDGIAFMSPKQLQSAMQAEATRYGAQLEACTIGDFKGYRYDTKVRVADRTWDQNTVVEGDVFGKLAMYNGSHSMSVNYKATGGGFNNDWDDKPFVRAELEAAQSEMQAIVASLKFSETAEVKKDDKIEAPRPVVKLTASSKRIRKGESVTLRAAVENAPSVDLPLKYAWSAGVEGSGDTTALKASKAGKLSASVTVSGRRGALGTASVDIDVDDVTLKITQVPAVPRIQAGKATSFQAALTFTGEQPKGKIIYRWQPYPEAKFEPYEGEATTTKVKFSKPGKVKVWAIALEKTGEVMTTVAESDQIDIEVIQPEIKLAIAPQSPLVGEEVKAAVTVTPAMGEKEADFRWDLPANAQLINESKDTREITFKLADTRQAEIAVRARVPVSGEAIGEAKASVTAKSYTVSAEVTGVTGPKPRVWKEGQGLVEDPKSIATFQNIGMKAIVTPQPSKKLRYQWSLNAGTSFAGGASGSEITVNRSTKGQAVASVTVTDENNIVLGKGSASAAVTIDQNDQDAARKKDSEEKKKKDLREKYAQAKALADQGKLDEALALIASILASDPQNADALALKKQILDKQAALKKAAEDKKKTEDAKKAADDKKISDTAKTEGTAGKPVAGPDSKAAGTGAGAVGAGTVAGKAAGVTGAALEPAVSDAAQQQKTQAQAREFVRQADGELDMYNLNIQRSPDGYRTTERLEAAVDKYTSALALVKDKETEKKLETAQKMLAGKKQYEANRVQAGKLEQEAGAFQKKNQYWEALAKYKESLALFPPLNRESMERQISNCEYSAKLQDADKVRAEGAALEKAGDIPGAVKKYEAAYKMYPGTYPFFMNFSDQIGKLKNRLTAAAGWKDEAVKFEKQKKWAEALNAYKTSFGQYNDPAVKEKIDAIELRLSDEKQAAKEAATLPAGSKTAVKDAEGEILISVDPDTDYTPEIRQLYADFAQAYQSKNESRVMSYIADQWSAGDGTTASDLRGYLRNSFSVFDEVRYAITNLNIRRTPNGQYFASYDVAITGRIFASDITHEEKSAVEEELRLDTRAKMKIFRTGTGTFWSVQ